MSVHRDRTHHRPHIGRLRGARSKWSFPWVGACTCGWSCQEMLWRNALIASLIHAEKVK